MFSTFLAISLWNLFVFTRELRTCFKGPKFSTETETQTNATPSSNRKRGQSAFLDIQNKDIVTGKIVTYTSFSLFSESVVFAVFALHGWFWQRQTLMDENMERAAIYCAMVCISQHIVDTINLNSSKHSTLHAVCVTIQHKSTCARVIIKSVREFSRRVFLFFDIYLT